MRMFPRAVLLGLVIGLGGSVGTVAADEIKPVQESRRDFAPIKIPETSRTAADFAKAERQWTERVLAEPFRKHAAGAEWEERATKFVAAALDRWTTWLLIVDASELAKEGNEILQAGCTDPLVRYLTAWLEWTKSGEWHAARRTMRDIFPAADEAEGPRALPLIVLMDYLLASSRGRRSPGELLDRLTPLIASAISDGSYGPEEAPLLVRHLAGPRWYPVEDYPDAISAAIQPAQIAEWAKEAIEGHVSIRRAWQSRGGGWASTVTREGWEGFEKHLTAARAQLVKSWELHSKDPVAPAGMITVTMGGMGEVGENVRTWFDRVVAAQCDYTPAYDSLANAYLPRWGGSHQKMLSFGEACVATERFDTEVPVGFFQVLGNLDRDANDIRALYKDPRIASTVLKLSKALTDEPARRPERRARLCFLAINAWLVGDYATSGAALKEVGPEPFPLVTRDKLHQSRLDENTFRGLVAALNSPGAQSFIKAEAAYEAGQLDSAAKLYQSALAGAEGTAAAYIKARLDVTTVEQKLAAGTWVDIPADRSLLGWTAEAGNWFSSGDGFPENRSDHGPVRIFYGARLGPNFEIRGEVRVDGKGEDDPVAGLVFAPAVESGARARWHGCQVFTNSNNQRVQAMYTYRDGTPRSSGLIDSEISDVNEFEIQVRDGKLTWKLNGKKIHDGLQLGTSNQKDPVDAGSRVGVGLFTRQPGFSVSLKRLSVRKL